MTLDAQSVASFYDAPLGAVVASLLRERLAALWPDQRGQLIVGVGYATPYLGLWRDDATAIADVATDPRATRPAPRRCIADGSALPFDDLSVNRILLVHGLEVADEARRLLRECWRILRDDGRLLVVAPNRAGLWAHSESNPFGQGQPYSQGQVERLLQSAMFAVDRRDAALCIPPLDLRPVRRIAPLFERLGRRLAPGLAGVLIADAVKDVYAAMPTAPADGRAPRAMPRRVVVAA
jgi:SAM-dependent methyltransferase